MQGRPRIREPGRGQAQSGWRSGRSRVESRECESPQIAAWKIDRGGVVEERGLNAYIAELLGTFVLVLFITLVVSLYTLHAAGDPTALVGGTFVIIGLIHAFVLMMLIQTLGGVSGGHFNPAVTLGLAAVKKIKPDQAAVYVLMQVIGAIAAAALCKLILDDIGASPHALKPSLANPSIGPLLDGKTALGGLCELIGTFVLVWAIMGVAVNPRGTADWAGLVIGTTLGFAVMVFGPLTGGSLNPARALGPAIVSGHFAGGFGKFLLVYVLGPAIGALMAALGYRALVLDPEHRLGERPIDKLA
jgi:glycerol uptake facilitator protein